MVLTVEGKGMKVSCDQPTRLERRGSQRLVVHGKARLRDCGQHTGSC